RLVWTRATGALEKDKSRVPIRAISGRPSVHDMIRAVPLSLDDPLGAVESVIGRCRFRRHPPEVDATKRRSKLIPFRGCDFLRDALRDTPGLVSSSTCQLHGDQCRCSIGAADSDGNRTPERPQPHKAIDLNARPDAAG